MKKICYVSAFLDIGRKNWTSFARSFDQYLNDFLPYIDMFKNNPDTCHEMIVFIDENVKHLLIEKIPDNLPFKVIGINEEYLCKNTIMWNKLSRETEILNSSEYKHKFAHRIGYPENNNPKYTLINHIKIEFVTHAGNFSDADLFCWTDFGYFKLKENIPIYMLNPYLFNCDKVTYTLLNNPSEKDNDIYYTMCCAPEVIGGFFFCCGKKIAQEYRDLYVFIHQKFQDNNLVDDDQHLALRCYFEKPELFDLVYTGKWHNALIKFQMQA